MSVPGWQDLRHGGLLLDGQRLENLGQHAPEPLDGYTEQQLRRHVSDDVPALVKFVLEQLCGFDSRTGRWTRGSNVAPTWGRRAVTGETVKPWQLWHAPGAGRLPVFKEPGLRVGIGRGRRTVSQVLGWLRAGNDHLALVTNGRQWRLLFAGLDFEAWCEWDVDLWFQDGKPSPQVDALRTLLQPKLWTPGSEDAASPLLQAVRDTRKGQAELSETLGERVREAVETLIQGHGEALKEQCEDVEPADIYRAACRVAMRLVVILFAESRDLLLRDNAVYHASYGLQGLLERLQKAGDGRSQSRRHTAWPQVQALFNLVRNGSHLPQLPVKDYGGDLFEPGSPDSSDGLSRALAVFETACLEREVLPDRDVRQMLEFLTRTRTRIRQGRGGTWATVPVDFSDLSSDYIGILYEGLLDYELKTAAPGEPVIFLAAGNYPALPLSRLEAMDDKAVKTLFGNLKKDVSDDDGPTEANADEAERAAGPLFDESGADAGPAADQDPRHTNRTRAETWARRAARVAGLVRKPRGKLTPECRLKADADLGRTARKLVARVVLPGEWYLVRWGGTRKGSGSFYTRPGLVVPTVQRTLRPLAYDPPVGEDGEPDRDAPAAKWTPKRPEQILELKVCDPACGSGAFVLSALRFLTDALFASLQHHERIQPDGERTMVRLLGTDAGDQSPAGGRLGDELVPCPPDHDDFEPRLKAVLRRHVVERCIYAVDLDPLAVELCRLSLWIETMDRTLPFGFLDHKVKCGNSLIGAWFDQFAHYPVMAWKNRQGGDQNHTNGVHFEKNARTKAIKAFVKDTLTPDLRLFLGDPDLFEDDHIKRQEDAHSQALKVLEQMHDLPVHDAAERARMYRDEFVGSLEWQSIKDAMDLWCACWFWPADEIECAPLPRTLADPSPETRSVARRVSRTTRFFHWELEFPDVFRAQDSGFDAMLGNPPWDTLQPNSKEYFTNVDPLYRSYGKQEALRRQHDLFSKSYVTEQEWLKFSTGFAQLTNYAKYAFNPFGDPANTDNSIACFAIGRGQGGIRLHSEWRRIRSNGSRRLASLPHPYVHMGTGKVYTYKLFLEHGHALCRFGGRLGYIVPSGLYSDQGTGPLRDLFLNQCKWEWLFGIENQRKIFPITTNYKFNPVILEKGGSTQAIRTAFMRRDVDDWARAEDIATLYSHERVGEFSPQSRAILEIRSPQDLDILQKLYANGTLLGEDSRSGGWGIQYRTEFNMTSDSDLFSYRRKLEEEEGCRPDEYSRWLSGNWRPIEELWMELGVDGCAIRSPYRPDLGGQSFDGTPPPFYQWLPVPRAAIPPGVVLSRTGTEWISEDDIDDVAMPLYEGKMIYVGEWVADPVQGGIEGYLAIAPKHLVRRCHIRRIYGSLGNGRIVFRLISRSTNERTFVSALVPSLYPCANSLGVLMPQTVQDTAGVVFLAACLSSVPFDWAVRQRIAGMNLNWHVVESLGVPRPNAISKDLASAYAARALAGVQFAVEWLNLKHCVPIPHFCAPTYHENMRTAILANAVVAILMGLSIADVRRMLVDCDAPRDDDVKDRDAKGFWRVDRHQDPELRQTVLTLIAFHDLADKIAIANGSKEDGIRDFCAQNDGVGWLIPESLRLADYDLGRDSRAKRLQPVASLLGSRLHAWQIGQDRGEAWRECHLHARNLLGARDYSAFSRQLDGKGPS